MKERLFCIHILPGEFEYLISAMILSLRIKSALTWFRRGLSDTKQTGILFRTSTPKSEGKNLPFGRLGGIFSFPLGTGQAQSGGC